LLQLTAGAVHSTVKARGQHIGHGVFPGILLNIHRCQLKTHRLHSRNGRSFPGGEEGPVVHPPLASHQIECGKTHDHRILKTGQKHTHKPDGFKIPNRAHSAFVSINGDPELIPLHCGFGTIGKGHCAGDHIGDKIASGLHKIIGTQAHPVLVIGFTLIEGVVQINILNRWQTSVGKLRPGRIAIHPVEVFIAVQNSGLTFVPLLASGVSEIVRGRVCKRLFQSRRIGNEARKTTGIIIKETRLVPIA